LQVAPDNPSKSHLSNPQSTYSSSLRPQTTTININMSFILRARPAFRPATRLFSTSIPRLNVVDGAKDVLKKVDRTVSDVAVKGIEVTRKLALSYLTSAFHCHCFPLARSHVLRLSSATNFLTQVPLLTMHQRMLPLLPKTPSESTPRKPKPPPTRWPVKRKERQQN
jgi:hypothetical protein